MSTGRRKRSSRRLSAKKRMALRRQRRRTIRRVSIGTGIVVAATAALVLLVPLATAQGPVCAEDPRSFPAFGIEGWKGEQLENAAMIMRAARELGVDREGQILGIMAAMGESTLQNIDYGDWETSGVTNPDGTRTTSIGLFQQQEWWGSVEVRMDPTSAATLFLQRLIRLPDWQVMEPSHAINRVQVNTDPEHYARFEDDATAVVDGLSGPCVL